MKYNQPVSMQGRSQELNFGGALHALGGAGKKVDPDKTGGKEEIWVKVANIFFQVLQCMYNT